MENQQVYSFIVPANMFKKVVKSYWQDVVSVVGHVNIQGVFMLEKIGRPAA
jgi:meiotically up-regulated gene 157 (Mug157) protein